MSLPRVQSYIAYCGEVPVVGVFAPTENTRKVAEQALRSVMSHEQTNAIGGIAESPRAPWMAVAVDPTFTPQETLSTLENFGSAEIIGSVDRTDVARFVGEQATEQLLGYRRGVL